MSLFHGLERESYDREYSDWELLRRIAGYFAPHVWRVLVIAATIIAIAFVGAEQLFIIARGLDAILQDAESMPLGPVVVLGAAVLATGIFNWAGNWVRRRLVTRLIGDVVRALRKNTFDAVIQHDMAFFDEYRSGRIISRITSDTEQFADVVQLVTDLLSQLTLVFILIVRLFQISWRLTLAVLLMSPVVVLLALAFRRVARRVTREGFQVLAEVNAAIQEAVTGIAVAKIFRQEAAIHREFSEVNQRSYRINLRRGFTLSMVFPVLNALSGVGTAVLVYWGGLTTADQEISVGNWYLFLRAVDQFWFPLINVAAFWSQFQAGLSASERIFALIDAEPSVQQINVRPLEQLEGDIHFDEVDFRYTGDEQVLKSFSLHIPAGESVALVGHTGAGKSSIAKLIARFYEFQGGQIRIDGQSIRSFPLHEYRAQLGFVTQSPFLFSGSVAENIRYAVPDLSDADILAMASRIGDGEWVDNLPNGLKTDVGERGGRLSMGQRQLVALMRVLVQSPAIFILDEATASVDPFTEMQIQEAIDLILQRSTSILIAHRLSTVRAVDRIIVLREGRIIEQGSHDDLMAQGGHYAELYDTYFRHQSLEYVKEVGERRWGSSR